jgi:hypothetical protein
MNIFVFDIETIPDAASGRKIHQLSESLSDEEVRNIMVLKQREKNGSSFIAHHLQQVVAISVVFHHNDKLQVFSVADLDSDEKTILSRFYHGIDKYIPTLVTWNGNGFDLPVLHYRSLLHGITASTYWEKGDSEQSFRWNNYLSRYHYRHLDLMDVLAGYTPRANAPLDDIATMLGFPGKMGTSGGDVRKLYEDGESQAIRDYCETDVLNTYLVYLRFERLRGVINDNEYNTMLTSLKQYLTEQQKPHFDEFLTLMTDN